MSTRPDADLVLRMLATRFPLSLLPDLAWPREHECATDFICQASCC
jgi:hypothetical protein